MTATKTYNPLLFLSEEAWQAQVIQAATLLGWMHYHTRDARRSPHGFPDLVLVKRTADGMVRLVIAELKRERGKVTPAQQAWIDVFGAVPGVLAFVWRPSDWLIVQQVLKGDA